MKMKRIITILLILAMAFGLLPVVSLAEQDSFLTPVTDPDAAAESDAPLYLYARDGVGPNSLTGTTHAKHHFLWDAEK